MTGHRLRRPLALAAITLATAALSGLPLVPADATSRHAPAAMIRGGHFSPNTPGVDVYLTSFRGKTTKLWLSGVGYGDVSGYERLAPGLYSVSMRPHGASPSTPAALSWTLRARPGAAYTACAVGMNAQLQGIVLRDELQAMPAGQARVRVIQAASRAAHADVTAVGGPAFARDVAFASSTDYRDVQAGRYTIRASAVDDPSVQATARVSLKPDTVHTVVLLDARSSGITVRVLDDAAGMAAPPVGAMPAGGGGTATRSEGLPDWAYGVLAGAGAALVTAAGALLTRGAAVRRRRAA